MIISPFNDKLPYLIMASIIDYTANEVTLPGDIFSTYYHTVTSPNYSKTGLAVSHSAFQRQVLYVKDKHGQRKYDRSTPLLYCEVK